jgi:hypothetical protein
MTWGSFRGGVSMMFGAIQPKSFVMCKKKGLLTSFTSSCPNAGQPSIKTHVAKKRPEKISHSISDALSI